MRIHQKHLKRITRFKRTEYHAEVHKLRKKYGLSKRTLLYMKEYGPHSHALKTILKESFFVLALTAVLSSFGGLALESIKDNLLSLLPVLILLPVLNDMIGDFGTIFSSKISTWLHEGKLQRHPLTEGRAHLLWLQVLLIAIVMVVFAGSLSVLISTIKGYAFSFSLVAKLILLLLCDVFFLVTLLFVSSTFIGLYLYKRKEDPSNFLIPITTAIADFGNMIIIALLVRAFF